MNDLRSQLEQMIKMGGMQNLMGMMPGMGKMGKKWKPQVLTTTALSAR
jgi:signal recognition particle subunit SRP54